VTGCGAAHALKTNATATAIDAMRVILLSFVRLLRAVRSIYAITHRDACGIFRWTS
jgi:hypothetical protein